jgi:dTDP-4-dehydrorhamnose 3,5-epimerase-like enzyme
MRVTRDERGYSWWDCIYGIKPGQINVSVTFPKKIRGFHLHKEKEDNITVLEGQFLLVLGTEEGGAITWERRFMGPGDAYTIPRNIWHGYQCVSPTPAKMMYYETEKSGPSCKDDYDLAFSNYDGWIT